MGEGERVDERASAVVNSTAVCLAFTQSAHRRTAPVLKPVVRCDCALWPRAGTFGRVLECWDRDTKSYVAIKVIRNVPKYHEAALIEVRQPDVRSTASVVWRST